MIGPSRENPQTQLAAVAAGALAASTAVLLLRLRLPQTPLWLLVAGCLAGVAVLLQIAASLRPVLRPFLHDMELVERLLLIVLGAVAFFVPSFMAGHWEIACGIVVVLGALLIAAPVRGAVVALIVLSGLVHALCLPRLPAVAATTHSLLFVGLLTFATAAEHFCFATTSRRPVPWVSPATILRAAWRPVLAGICVAGVVGLLTPPLKPLLNVSPSQQRFRGSGFSMDAEFATVSNALLRVASLLLVLFVLGLVYWLHRRWKKRREKLQQELDEFESEYVLQREEGQAAASQPRSARTARAEIVELFQQFVRVVADAGYPRGDDETVNEYLDELAAGEVVGSETADALRSAFTRARYEAAPMNKEEVRRFSRLVERAIAEFRRRPTTGQNAREEQ
jgi:hypothetical protein